MKLEYDAQAQKVKTVDTHEEPIEEEPIVKAPSIEERVEATELALMDMVNLLMVILMS
jgi:hypothetical protein